MLLCYDETTKLLRRDKKLKKIISLFMAFVFTFALFGCGKAANTSEEAKKDSKDNVKEFIEMMDSVLETIASKSLPLQKEGSYNRQTELRIIRESEPEILALIDTFDALSLEEQEQELLRGRAITLKNWESSLAEAKKYSEYSGEWVDVLHPGNHFILNEDGSYQSNSIEPGRWSFYDDKLGLENGRGYTNLSDDGIPLLYWDKELLVKASEADNYFNTHFVTVEITPDNIREYISEPIMIGNRIDEWGETTDTPMFHPLSIAYRNGLVLVGWSEDFKYELIASNIFGSGTVTVNEPFLVIRDYSAVDSFCIGERAMGTLTFVRSEYVSNNYLSDYQRIVELSNGVVFKSSAYDWKGITANYEDYKY